MAIRHLAAIAAIPALFAIAPADAAVFCELTSDLDSFRVLEWENADGKGTLTMDVDARDVVEVGEEGRDYLMAGIFVLDPDTGRTLATTIVTDAGTSAAVHVQTGDQWTVRRLPQRDLAAGTRVTRSIHPGTFPAGTYHVVGISMGGGDGLSIDGTEDRTETHTEVSATGLTDCAPLEVDGTLRHIDEHDFRGFQVSAGPVAVRDGTEIDVDIADDLVVGAMQHAGTPTSYLEIWTPTGGGRLAHTVAPLSSFAGRYTFKLDQFGAPARANVNFLSYSFDGSSPDPDPGPY